MTLISKLPLGLNQKFHLFAKQLESLFIKLEVITDSNAIVNSVRIMIVTIALLMGYIHTPKEKNELAKTNKIEKLTEHNKTGFTNMSR